MMYQRYLLVELRLAIGAPSKKTLTFRTLLQLEIGRRIIGVSFTFQKSRFKEQPPSTYEGLVLLEFFDRTVCRV
jgi:hypothetical protein